MTRRDDSKLWIAYSNIQGKSNSLKEKQGEGGDPDLKPSMDAEGNVIPIAEEADKWVLKVCEEIINEYKDQFTLEELIFGPGMFESLVRLIIFKNCFKKWLNVLYFGYLKSLESCGNAVRHKEGNMCLLCQLVKTY